MKSISKRAKRMETRRKRSKQPALNLVSLMDVFTILVFFLLISSTNSQQLPSNKDLKLPTSISKTSPKETTVVTVTKTNILVQGREVATISQVLNENDIIITGLQNELIFLSTKTEQSTIRKNSKNDHNELSLTIMGDENLTYELLRKILATCRETRYTKIAFAAFQKSNKS